MVGHGTGTCLVSVGAGDKVCGGGSRGSGGLLAREIDNAVRGFEPLSRGLSEPCVRQDRSRVALSPSMTSAEPGLPIGAKDSETPYVR